MGNSYPQLPVVLRWMLPSTTFKVSPLLDIVPLIVLKIDIRAKNSTISTADSKIGKNLVSLVKIFNLKMSILIQYSPGPRFAEALNENKHFD